MSQAMAFLTDFSFIISLAVMFFSMRSITAIPACLASIILFAETAGILPFPGSAIPMASHRQFMLLAVYIPEHDPHPGHTFCSYSFNPSSSMMPAFLAPTASNILDRLVSVPLTRPDIIGPPEHTMAGRSILEAAMTMPGTILSQLGTSTMPSKA